MIAWVAPDRGTRRGPVCAGTELVRAMGPLLGAQVGESLRLFGGDSCVVPERQRYRHAQE
jgi:hypothetical protein